MLYRFARIGLLFAAGLALAPSLSAQDLLAQFEDRVTTFTLDNGLDFIIIENHDAPVVSFFTYADVGSVNEPVGQTGIAHMFEHMAFKGTTTIGTTDIRAELDALAAEEEAARALFRARALGPLADSAEVARLEAEFQVAAEAAEALIDVDTGFDVTVERAGAVGLNAFTSADATGYLYSMPSNRLELWFATESDRFLNPVLREFYTERDVVMEERRQRTDSNPIGRMIEEFITLAFKAHPYGQPTVGHMSDLQNITRTQAEAFFATYYAPNNLTIAISGDVDPVQARAFAERYFGRLERGEDPPAVTTVEPPQLGERRVVIYDVSQPVMAVGFHRPSRFHPDAQAFSVLQDVLSSGRTSRLYRELVETQIAAGSQVLGAFPGSKYPTLFAVLALPTPGTSIADLESALLGVLDAVAEEGITDEELRRAKTRARAGLIRSLTSNMGRANQFAEYQALTGDWRNVFRELDALEAVTAADVQRIAAETFRPENRTVAVLDTAPTASAE